MYKPTVYFVIDTETSGHNQTVHDFAWIAIDKNGNEYSRGSYFFNEVFQDVKKREKKLEEYLPRFNRGEIFHGSWSHVREYFNNEIIRLQEVGHRVVITAYNAEFDSDKLDLTEFNLRPEKYFIEHGILKGMRDSSLASYVTAKVAWLDIWMEWAKSCPRSYQSETKTKTGRMTTTAQDVARFEIDPNYVQHHYGIADCEGEAKILLKVLARKKKFSYDSIFENKPSKICHERVTYADRLAKAA